MTPDEAILSAAGHYAAYQDHIRANSIPAPTGCWLWNGALNTNGYGVARVCGVRVLAHRLSLAAFSGLNLDRQVLHACDTPACVSPDHLREGTHAENMKDMNERGRAKRPSVRDQVGAMNANSRLTEAQVCEVRRLKLVDGLTYSQIEAKTGVRRANAWAVVSGKSWAHVPSDTPYQRERRPIPRGFDGIVRPRDTQEKT
jgi:hypothetical protein